MNPLRLCPIMRPLVAALALLALLAPAAAAAVPDEVPRCTNLHCMHAQDTDGDGEIDRVTFSSGSAIHGPGYALNVVWQIDEELWYEAVAHEDDHHREFLLVHSSGHAHYGADHRHVDGFVRALYFTPETAEEEEVVWFYYGVAPPGHVHEPHLP